MTATIAPSAPDYHRDHNPVGLLPCICCGEDRMYVRQAGTIFYAYCRHIDDEDEGFDALGTVEGPVRNSVREAALAYNAMVKANFRKMRELGF